MVFKPIFNFIEKCVTLNQQGTLLNSHTNLLEDWNHQTVKQTFKENRKNKINFLSIAGYNSFFPLTSFSLFHFLLFEFFNNFLLSG